MYQKLQRKNYFILFLFLIIIALVGTLFLTYHELVKEQEKIKNAIIPPLKEDYYSNQLFLTNYNIQRELEQQKWLDEYKDEYGIDEWLVDDYNRILNVPRLSQMSLFPNGCEAVSTVMMLNYYGISITPQDFILQYLPMDKVYEENGKRYGPDPSKYYAGDPKDSYRGWGAFSPVIAKSIQELLKDNPRLEVYNLTNSNIDNLKYFLPVVIWVTIDYSKAEEVYEWYSYDGTKTYTYPKNAHAVLLTGVDNDFYYINDPLKAEETVKVEKETLRISYDSMGRQAIGIMTIDEDLYYER